MRNKDKERMARQAAVHDFKEQMRIEEGWEQIEKLESMLGNGMVIPKAPQLTQYFSGSLKYSSYKKGVTPYFRFKICNRYRTLYETSFFYNGGEKNLDNKMELIDNIKNNWETLYENYEKEPEAVRNALDFGSYDDIIASQFDALKDEIKMVLEHHHNTNVNVDSISYTKKKKGIQLRGNIILNNGMMSINMNSGLLQYTFSKVFRELSFKTRSYILLEIDETSRMAYCSLSDAEQEREMDQRKNNMINERLEYDSIDYLKMMRVLNQKSANPAITLMQERIKNNTSWSEDNTITTKIKILHECQLLTVSANIRYVEDDNKGFNPKLIIKCDASEYKIKLPLIIINLSRSNSGVKIYPSSYDIVLLNKWVMNNMMIELYREFSLDKYHVNTVSIDYDKIINRIHNGFDVSLRIYRKDYHYYDSLEISAVKRKGGISNV